MKKWLVNIPAEIGADRWYVVGDKNKALLIASVTRQDATRGKSLTKTCIESAIYAHEQAGWMADDMATVKEQSNFNVWLKTGEFAQICDEFGVEVNEVLDGDDQS